MQRAITQVDDGVAGLAQRNDGAVGQGNGLVGIVDAHLAFVGHIVHTDVLQLPAVHRFVDDVDTAVGQIAFLLLGLRWNG